MLDQPRESRGVPAPQPPGAGTPRGALDDIVALAAAGCGCHGATVLTADTVTEHADARIARLLYDDALRAPDLLIVEDLAADPRLTDADREVARFYAGVPIRLASGESAGVLSVFDGRPRSLAAHEADALRRLARLAATHIEPDRRGGEKTSSVAANAQAGVGASERQWRGLFEKLSDGFLVGELVRDADGRAIDWTYLDVNAAWSSLTGIPAERAIGTRVRALMAGSVDDAWVADPAAVVDTGRPRIFTRALGTPARQYEGHAFHLEGDRFAVVLIEITDRHRAGLRQAALLTLGDRLRDLDEVGAMTREAARLVGETLDVSRACFGQIDADRGTILIEPDWTATGVASVAGEHRFADYGHLLGDMLAGEAVAIEDVRRDPRTAADPGAMLAVNVVALVNVPVRERGRTVAAFAVHDRNPRVWTADELAFLRNVADRVEVGVARLRADGRQAVLNRELSHRMKNSLALVQAIATQTLGKSVDRDAMGRFEQRLGALANAHDVLLGGGVAAADLETIARGVLGVIAPDRVTIAGPPVELGARAAVSLSLVLHELCTNAAKYGALGVEDGEVSVCWRIDADGVLTLEWRERGGPPTRPPTRRGFGSRLINMGLTGTGGVDVDYATIGFSATMRSPVAELQSA